MTIAVTEWKHSIGIPAGRGGRSLFVPVLRCQALELRPFFTMVLKCLALPQNHRVKATEPQSVAQRLLCVSVAFCDSVVWS